MAGPTPDTDPMTPHPTPPGATDAGSAAARGWRFEFWLVAAIVILDQITKALVRAYVPLHDSVPIVGHVLNLVHVRNTGAAFGLLNDVDFPYKAVVVVGFAAAALAGIAYYASTLGRHERLARVGLMLILAGAVGNLIDRVVLGEVVDFVDVVIGNWHFWAFNVADSAITLGVAAMLLDTLVGAHVSKTP